MEKEVKGHHGAEIQFSSISPLELWDRLGLAQPRVETEQDEVFDPLFSQFLDEESMAAYAAFKEDCLTSEDFETENVVLISSEKGSLFLWALLHENGKRSKKEKKLSSINHIFKDDMLATIRRKGKKIRVSFDEEDFDTIASFLQNKSLVRTSENGIRVTQKFAKLFHERYNAWLVF